MYHIVQIVYVQHILTPCKRYNTDMFQQKEQMLQSKTSFQWPQ